MGISSTVIFIIFHYIILMWRAYNLSAGSVYVNIVVYLQISLSSLYLYLLTYNLSVTICRNGYDVPRYQISHSIPKYS
jgi:hypothetical protein